MSVNRKSVLLVAAVVLGAVLGGVVMLRADGQASAQGKRAAVEVDLRAPKQLPRLPVAAAKQTQAGATAFALFWFDALNYSLAHKDTDLLAPHTGAGCKQCTGWLIAIQAWKDSGATLEGGLTVPLGLAIGPARRDKPVSFAATFLTTPATVTQPDGKAADYPGGRTRGGLTILWLNERWQMTDIVLDVTHAEPPP